MTTQEKLLYERMFELGFAHGNPKKLLKGLRDMKLVWLVNDTADNYALVPLDASMDMLRLQGVWPK